MVRPLLRHGSCGRMDRMGRLGKVLYRPLDKPEPHSLRLPLDSLRQSGIVPAVEHIQFALLLRLEDGVHETRIRLTEAGIFLCDLRLTAGENP